MKAVLNEESGTISILRRPTNMDEVDSLLAELRRLFLKMRAVCEDRTVEVFPHGTVARIVAVAEEVVRQMEEIEVPVDYVSWVENSKNAVSFFAERIGDCGAETARLRQKRELLGDFSERLSEMPGLESSEECAECAQY